MLDFQTIEDFFEFLQTAEINAIYEIVVALKCGLKQAPFDWKSQDQQGRNALHFLNMNIVAKNLIEEQRRKEIFRNLQHKGIIQEIKDKSGHTPDDLRRFVWEKRVATLRSTVFAKDLELSTLKHLEKEFEILKDNFCWGVHLLNSLFLTADKTGSTPGHRALRNKHPEAFLWIWNNIFSLRRKPNITHADQEGRTLLHEASIAGYGDIIRLMLDRRQGSELEPKEVLTCDSHGNHALYFSAHHGHVNIIQFFLTFTDIGTCWTIYSIATPEVKKVLENTNELWMSVFYDALFPNLQKCIENGAVIEAFKLVGAVEWPVFRAAILANHHRTVSFLLNLNPRNATSILLETLEKQECKNLTFFDLAVQHANTFQLKPLQVSLLVLATLYDHIEQAEQLLKQGGHGKEEALCIAAAHGKVKMMELILRYKPDLYTYVGLGEVFSVSMVFAILNHQLDSVNLLFLAGFNLNFESTCGSLLKIAAESDAVGIVRFLLEVGAAFELYALQSAPPQGQVAKLLEQTLKLRAAIKEQNKEQIIALVTEGACVYVREICFTLECDPLLHLAIESGDNWEIFAILEKLVNPEYQPNFYKLAITAIVSERMQILKEFIHRKYIDPNFIFKNGVKECTLLAHAVDRGHNAAALLLLELGAEPFFKKKGRDLEYPSLSAFECAIKTENTEVLRAIAMHWQKMNKNSGTAARYTPMNPAAAPLQSKSDSSDFRQSSTHQK